MKPALRKFHTFGKATLITDAALTGRWALTAFLESGEDVVLAVVGEKPARIDPDQAQFNICPST